jgi:excisionase family DNA binding protein
MARLSINQRLDHLESILKLMRSEIAELSGLLKGTSIHTKVSEQNDAENVIWTPKEVAELLHIDIDTIYLRCKNKELPHFRAGKLYRFRKADILEWRDAQKKLSKVSVDDYVDTYLQKHALKG